MNSSNIRFSLDIQSTQSQVSIPVSLNDTARVLHISLTDGSAPYTIADGCLAVVSIKRPSGTHIEAFCVIENNTTIKYNFDDNPDTAIVEGLHDCQVTLFDANEKQVASAWFSMVVHDRVVNSSDITLTDEDRTAVDSMLAEEAARQVAENERVAAEAKRVSAEAARAEYHSEFVKRVDGGEFKGEPGEPGEKGDRGDKGETGKGFETVYYDGTVTVDSGERGKHGTVGSVLPLIEGDTYKVEFNGKLYRCVLSYKGDGVYLCLGNASMMASSAEDTGEPFCVWLNKTTDTTYLYAEEYGDYKLRIYTEIEGIGNLRDTLQITLKASDWPDNKQTIEAAEVAENCTLVVNPTEGSKDAYIAGVIELTEAEVGKMVFTCVNVPTEDIGVLVHVVGSLVEVESTKILSFDSVDEMNAYQAEEGAIALVPSEGGGGGGMPVVELSTIPTDTSEQMLTEAENTALNAVADKDNIFVKFKYGEEAPPVLIPMTAYEMEGLPCFSGVYMYNGINNVYLLLGNTGEGWLMVVMGA